MRADELKSIVASHAEWLAGRDGKQANLIGANLSGTDLTGADLRGANLSKANLTGTNLSKANLSGTDLSGTDLSEADLSWTSLRVANLSEANLSKTNLTGANLTGATLSEADLSVANLSETKGVLYAQCSFSAHGERGRQLLAVVIGDQPRFFCGCFTGTLAELDAYIKSGDAKYKATRRLARNFVRAALDAYRIKEGGAS